MVMHFSGDQFSETNFVFAICLFNGSMVSLYRKERFVAISESTSLDIQKFGISRTESPLLSQA